MNKIVLIGNGGHSKVIKAMIDRTDGYILAGILDGEIDKYIEENDVFYDNTDNIEDYKAEFKLIIAIGDSDTRQKIVEENDLEDEHFISVIDASSIIAPDVKIGIGTVVMPGVVINPGTMIGKHSIINTKAVVEHDNTLGDFVHISPNATLAGTVTVKDATHIGSGTTVIPNTTIGQNVVIGAGSVVTHEVSPNAVVVGVPAKIIRRRF